MKNKKNGLTYRGWSGVTILFLFISLLVVTLCLARLHLDNNQIIRNQKIIIQANLKLVQLEQETTVFGTKARGK